MPVVSEVEGDLEVVEVVEVSLVVTAAGLEMAFN